MCGGGGGGGGGWGRYPKDNVAGEIRKPLGMLQGCKSSSPACNWNLDVLQNLIFFITMMFGKYKRFYIETVLFCTRAFIRKYEKAGPMVIKILNSFMQTHFVQYAEYILNISVF